MTTTLSSARSRAGSRPGDGKGVLAAGADVRLALAAHRPGERPKNALPALAVLGRSNVGKSSLLNALLGVKVARVSQTPGRTQALYWYRVDERFDLVDCPGYGFAKTSRGSPGFLRRADRRSPSRRDRGGRNAEAAFRPAVALLLVDGRLEPQESDRSMALFLTNSGVPTFVAATKWDAVKPSRRVRQLRALAADFEAPDRPLLPVSSETGENLARRLVAAPGRAALSRLRPEGVTHAPTQGPRRRLRPSRHRPPRASRRRRGAAGPGRARRADARHPDAPQPHDAAAPQDRAGAGGRGRAGAPQAGADLQDPPGPDGAARPHLLGGRPRGPAGRLRLPARPRVQLPRRARTTSTSRRRRSGSSACGPATRSPARSARRRKGSVTSPSSRSRRSTSSTRTSRARRSSSTT